MELDNLITDIMAEDLIIDLLGGGGDEDVFNMELENGNDMLKEDYGFMLLG